MATTSTNRTDMRIDEILAVAQQLGYTVETDEWSDIMLQRTIVLRQVRRYEARDTELRIEVRTDQQTGRRHTTLRGWHHFTTGNRGKVVSLTGAVSWLRVHAAS